MAVVVDNVEGRIEPPAEPGERPEEASETQPRPIEPRKLELALMRLERQRCRLMAD